PVCSASVITGTSPAHDTRLSSSNTAESGKKLCDTCTGSAFLRRVTLLCGNSNHPSSKGTFLISTLTHSSTDPWIEAKSSSGSRETHGHNSDDRRTGASGGR